MKLQTRIIPCVDQKFKDCDNLTVLSESRRKNNAQVRKDNPVYSYPLPSHIISPVAANKIENLETLNLKYVILSLL